MNVSLTPELAKFVAREIESGSYPNASEVVRAGLRRLRADRSPDSRSVHRSLAELESRLLEGIDRLDRGQGVSGEVALRRFRKRIKGARARS